MFTMNKSHVNKTVIRKVLGAIRHSQKLGHTQAVYIHNSKDQPFMRLKPVKLSKGVSFELIDKAGQSVSNLIVEGCFSPKIPTSAFNVLNNKLI